MLRQQGERARGEVWLVATLSEGAEQTIDPEKSSALLKTKPVKITLYFNFNVFNLQIHNVQIVKL